MLYFLIIESIRYPCEQGPPLAEVSGKEMKCKIFYGLTSAGALAEKTPVPEDLALLGGRALISALAQKEIDPGCHPLGKSNVLILAPGLLSGTAAPTTGRLSVGGKSPLTGGIKEANAGGNAAQYLGRMGFKAVTFHGRFPGKEGVILVLGQDRAHFEPAEGLWGLGNYALAQNLLDRFGPQACIVSCGPAGEMGMSGASVAVTDRDGHPNQARGPGRPGRGHGPQGAQGRGFAARGAQAPGRGTAG